MKIPQKCRASKKKLVCKLLKSLYGLKQAEKLLNKTLTKFFQRIGFISTNTNMCILII